ncbi:XdhC family protein [Chondromyces crocatus]|uniref:XdhC/CoxI family protein n=1 Tax=Chondromyces crocatus TaxID=52 RepID=A0A0K1ETJ7_CHOCO|nr:XdhC/CoxI family protein [Chondromyces crocatus]AKT44104.1 XdhC/CoxI family protein [Chondromyces crocatus]
MRELRDIVAAYEALAQAGEEVVLATVVQTRGSTYRKAGARMLMSSEGWLAGAISGGCVEGDLLRKAWFHTTQERAAVVTYDGAREAEGDEDEAEDGENSLERPVRWGFGLGCDGSIDVLLERVRVGDRCHPITALGQVIRARRRAVLSTVVRAPEGPGEPEGPGRPEGLERSAASEGAGERVRVGQRVVLVEGACAVTDVGGALAAVLTAEAEALLASADTARSVPGVHLVEGGMVEVVHEVLLPPRRLVVFGSNHDALPVARMAHDLGWEVAVVERRSTLSSVSRALSQVARVVVGRAPEVVAQLGLCARTSVVVMTHNVEEDRAILQGLRGSAVGYVGMLGPRRRTARILTELAAGGTPVDEGLRARLHGPVGLDLGASAPEEIALAILAEVHAVATGRSARPLCEEGAVAPVGSGEMGAVLPLRRAVGM